MIKGSVTAFKIIGDSITHEHGELCRKYINRDSVVFLKSVDEQEDLEEEFLDRFDGKYIDVEFIGKSKVDQENIYEFDWITEIRNENINEILKGAEK